MTRLDLIFIDGFSSPFSWGHTDGPATTQEHKVMNQGENQRYDLCLRCLAKANEASKSDPTIDSGCPSSCR